MRLLGLAPAALAALSGCTERTHAPRTAVELADEVRVIAAVARAEILAGMPIRSHCVARRIEASASLDSLPATDLSRIDGRVDPAAERASGATAVGRTLSDADLIAEIGREGLGSSCSGSTFLTFYRIQFSGDVAIAFVNSRNTCGWGMAVYKLRRNGESWAREDMRVLSHADAFVCRDGGPEERAGFFTVRGRGVTDNRSSEADGRQR